MMNKIAIVGALLLVIFGCVFTSGCTLTAGPNENIIGIWEFTVTNDNESNTKYIDVFNLGGTGYCANVIDGIVPSFGNIVSFTWKKIAENTYAVTFKDSYKVVTFTYNPIYDCLINDMDKSTLVRVDPIVGIWTGVINKSSTTAIKFIDVLKNNGLGYSIDAYPDGKIDVFELSWKKSTDRTYTLNISDGTTITWTLNLAKDTAVSSLGSLPQKVNYAATFPAVVGPWVNEDQNKFVTMFNLDGTGSIYMGDILGTARFIWKSYGNGMINVHFTSGKHPNTGNPLLGNNYFLTYDTKNQTITSSTNISRIRPSETIEGFTILTY